MFNSSHGQAHGVEMNQDWQTGKLSLQEKAKHLLMTGLYTDCQFLVGANGGYQEVIKAHKLYLTQSSPVFEAMLFGKMTEGAVTNEMISIPDLTPSCFKDLLWYIYSNFSHGHIQSVDQAMDLYYAAKKYILPDLVVQCSDYMEYNLCPKYTCRLLEFSNFFEEEDLKEECLSMLRERTVESLASPDFEELPESTVLEIVKEEDLYIRELELFDAVVRWAGHQCALKDLEVNGHNLRQILGEITNQIRFLAMKPEDFAKSPALSGILSQEECFAISMNLNNPGSLPMPLHLSSCRKQRCDIHRVHLSKIFSALHENGRLLYCLRDVENEALILKEPFIEKDAIFDVDQAIILKGVVFAAMVLADQDHSQDYVDIELDCFLLDYNRGTKLASGRVSQPLDLHETPITYELVFNHSVRLEPHCFYLISVSVSKRAHFRSGMASTALSEGVKFDFHDWYGGAGFVQGLIFNLG